MENKQEARESFTATAKICLQQHKDGDMTTAAAIKILNAAMRKCARAESEGATKTPRKVSPVANSKPTSLLAALTKELRAPKTAPRKTKAKSV